MKREQKMESLAYVDPKQMIALEQELQQLKEQYGTEERTKWWMKVGDWMVSHGRTEETINRKKYIRLALTCGWFCGSHRFYAGQKVTGLLYLLFCWTGIPFAMTLIDLMIVIPMKADENGLIQI